MHLKLLSGNEYVLLIPRLIDFYFAAYICLDSGTKGFVFHSSAVGQRKAIANMILIKLYLHMQ